MRKKFMSVLLSFVFVLSCMACGSSSNVASSDGIESVDNVNPVSDETVTKPLEDTILEETALESTAIERGTTMSLEKEGGIVINRNVDLGDVPMGEDGTWTVFVYLCGSDLESAKDRGFATLDMQEMLAASTGENVRFVIQTGGANKWCNDVVAASELGRYEICNGSITKIDVQVDASMGDTDTLVDFLEWGVENYPAANMGVVFWDHGGGSIAGVCVDENWERDRLYLTEIDAALARVAEKMTDKFEFIGFDACLMATVENANILAPYANYMYASEETEAGYGWDYTAIGNYLGMNPDANGEELGRVVCDSFFDMLEQINLTDNGTLSVTDLSKLDNLLKSYHLYAKDLDAASKDLDVFTLVVRNLRDAEWFGNNSKATGYTNMIDLAGFVSAGAEYSTNTSQTLETIDEAVIYVRKGSLHEDSCGLSTYYPLAFNGKTELEIFGDIAISPYYLSFVTRTAYGLEHNGDMSGYVEQEVVDVWSDTWSGEDTTEEADNYWDSYGNTEISGQSQLIQFELEPTVSKYEFEGEDRYVYKFKLTEESGDKVAAIYNYGFMLSPDGEYLLELGNRALFADKDKSRVYAANISIAHHISIKYDNAVEVGQYVYNTTPIATYLVHEDYDATGKKNKAHYMVPMLVNGEATYVHMTDFYDGYGIDCYNLEGIWNGINADGTTAREMELNVGDVLTPIYNAISMETGEQTIYYGQPLVYSVSPEHTDAEGHVSFEKYTDGIYGVYFEIVDAFGNTYETDIVLYEKVNGQVTGYQILD